MPPRAAISIGNFDGVHCGHRELIRVAREEVGASGRVIVYAFDPHPLSTLRPGTEPKPLTTFAQRSRLLADAGADEVVRLEPTPELLGRSPEQFVEMLVERHRPVAIVEGGDFRFGRGRTGSIETLQELGVRFGFKMRIIEPIEVVLCDHSIVRASSTLARWLVERGRVKDAAIVLGAPFEIESVIEPGARRGRDLGFPTANLARNGCIMPADGVYAGRATTPDGRWRNAAISVGRNPTFGDEGRRCEAYLLDFDGPPGEYGWTMRLEFTAWLRDQVAYSGASELIDQLRRDVERVRQLSEPITVGA